MRDPVTIQIANIDSVMAMFKIAPLKMTEEIHRAVNKAVILLERNIKKEAPVNKRKGGGNLRQSVRGTMTGIASGAVEVGASYGAPVNDGSVPHLIRAKNRKVLADRRNGIIFGRVVKHPGTKANPFFDRGVDKSRAEIDKYFIRAVQNTLK